MIPSRSLTRKPRSSPPTKAARGRGRKSRTDPGFLGLIAGLEQEKGEKSPSFTGVPGRKWMAVAKELRSATGEGTEQNRDFLG
ncbi:hypothetical protein SLEP1_g57798 [Rubroshorea leprosula]|uniref:Uncharacterized protein n=1 Tax=Rubroshorea leprosula TaxID=152421 RepID=A0AAV5MNH0_9ROSI|nr:hypothetical protein SLEP1_g57798 [Rubroshorea leprosula]